MEGLQHKAFKVHKSKQVHIHIELIKKKEINTSLEETNLLEAERNKTQISKSCFQSNNL